MRKSLKRHIHQIQSKCALLRFLLLWSSHYTYVLGGWVIMGCLWAWECFLLYATFRAKLTKLRINLLFTYASGFKHLQGLYFVVTVVHPSTQSPTSKSQQTCCAPFDGWNCELHSARSDWKLVYGFHMIQFQYLQISWCWSSREPQCSSGHVIPERVPARGSRESWSFDCQKIGSHCYSPAMEM